MRRLLAILATLAVSLTFVPGTATAAKKCKKGQAVAVVKGKARCVKKCPAGQEKRKIGKTVRCVRVKEPAPPGPDGLGPAPDPGPDGDSAPPAPQFDPLAKYTEIVRRMHLLRNYQVPKPSGGGYNNHSEEYAWCDHPTDGRIMVHYYEGIAYIYKSAGRYTVLSGEASEDGTSGIGVIRYTQDSANFDEERGKTLDIQISWQGDTATVAHPEIGTNQFAKSVRSSESCG